MNDAIEDLLREIERSLEPLSERSELSVIEKVEEIEESIEGIREEMRLALEEVPTFRCL